jgi:uncharacterized protein (DUF885 family)
MEPIDGPYSPTSIGQIAHVVDCPSVGDKLRRFAEREGITMRIAFAMVLFCALPAAAAQSPRLENLPIPGDAAFVRVARDVAGAVFAIDPSAASGAGLWDDAARVPSYTPAAIAELTARLERDLAALRALPWRRWSVDQQIDFRWVFANAESARRQLADEKLYLHRPAQWLEPLANDLINLFSYVPERTDLVRRLLAQAPTMVAEARQIARPTRRDVTTAVELLGALTQMAQQSHSREGAAAATAFEAYRAELAALKPAQEFAVVGPENYAWRYQHANLSPWTPSQLLAIAEDELKKVDIALDALKPHLASDMQPSETQKQQAVALTKEAMLALYNEVEVANRAATVRGGFVSVPNAVGPIAARETPDAMVPLTGDGGSMNPPPTYWNSNIGYWNVEHFHATWPAQQRLKVVMGAAQFQRTGLGPYSAHEGYPGHHLQLAIARLNKDPLRSILQDNSMVEGWALYSEGELWSHGGLGPTVEAHAATLRSFRHRIARVFYDVNIETGVWDLQRAADFKDRAEPGRGVIDEDLLRSIQWPTQLICYFSGRMQILALRDEYKKKMGAKYNERAFNDALLAEGSIPIALIRAKLLGETVPGI